MGHERHRESNGGGSDPPVSIVNLVAEGVASPDAAVAELGTNGGQVVISLDEAELA